MLTPEQILASHKANVETLFGLTNKAFEGVEKLVELNLQVARTAIGEVAEMPNLIEVQRSSYEQFLQMHTPAASRDQDGLEAVFKSVFPIKDFSDRATLEYISYEFEAPKFDVQECMQRDLNFAAPLKVKLRLIVFEMDEETGAKSIKDIKEQSVYMGDMPLMEKFPAGKAVVKPRSEKLALLPMCGTACHNGIVPPKLPTSKKPTPIPTMEGLLPDAKNLQHGRDRKSVV